MKKLVPEWLIKIFALFVVAAICNLVYYIGDLSEIFGKAPNYLQWLSITIISSLLIIKPVLPKKDA